MEAVARYGVVRGGMKAAWRLARCHPLSKGGFDPVVSRQLPVASGNQPDVGDVYLMAARTKPGVPGTPLKESTS